MKDYTHQDRMGSTTNLTDQFGRVVGRADYNEWGQITYKDALDITSSYRRIYPQLSYTGHDWDDVLGMYYAKARFYDADTKRFVAIDPIKGSVTDPLSLVSYIYCEDNPLRWVDPLGLRPVKDDPRESFTTKTTLPKPKAPRPAADVKKLTNNEKKQKQNPGVSKPDPKQTLNEAKQNAALPTPKERVIVLTENSTYLTGGNSAGTNSLSAAANPNAQSQTERNGIIVVIPAYASYPIKPYNQNLTCDLDRQYKNWGAAYTNLEPTGVYGVMLYAGQKAPSASGISLFSLSAKEAGTPSPLGFSNSIGGELGFVKAGEGDENGGWSISMFSGNAYISEGFDLRQGLSLDGLNFGGGAGAQMLQGNIRKRLYLSGPFKGYYADVTVTGNAFGYGRSFNLSWTNPHIGATILFGFELDISIGRDVGE